MLVGPQQLRVGAWDVPALDERVKTGLPVGVDDHGFVPGNSHVLELVALQTRGHRVEVVEQWFGVWIHVHEDPSPPRVDLHLGEAQLPARAGIEVLLVGDVLERAVEVPAPGVKRAPEFADAPLSLHEPRSAMPAGIEVGPQALLGPDHHDRLIADLKIDVVANPLHFVEATGIEPRPREQAL